MPIMQWYLHIISMCLSVVVYKPTLDFLTTSLDQASRVNIHNKRDMNFTCSHNGSGKPA